MTKIAIDTTKAGKTRSGIMDITETPDVALWSNEVTTGNVQALAYQQLKE